MGNPFELADVLGRYVKRSGYTPGQLARLTGIPKATIVNWLDGRVRKPRSREDLITIAAKLHLNEAEASELLHASGHPTVPALYAAAHEQQNAAMLSLLSPWLEWINQQRTPAPFQAPPELPYFVGRQREVMSLARALQAERHSGVYSIQGMIGVGKTVLATHLAYRLRAHFPDGVLWAQSDVSDVMSILSTFALAYGVDIRAYADVDSRSRVVRELLADKRVLIVLDSVSSSEAIQPLLPPTGHCAVLITTRRHDLAVTRGGFRLELGPFDPEREEGVALMTAILGEERVDRERPSLLRLAELLGQLPLALDIAASRLAYEPGWSTESLLERLSEERRRLQELSFESQSVRTSLGATFAALSEEKQRFLAALSALGDADFDVAAAAAVAAVSDEDAGDHLRQLYGLSLVQLVGDSRYRLHQLVRAYAAEAVARLAPPLETTLLERRARYFISLVEARPRAFSHLDGELSNVLSALAVAEQLELNALFVGGVTAVYHFLEARGLYARARALLARAWERSTEVVGDGQQAQLLHYLGRVAQRFGEYIEAETRYEAALALARQSGDEARSGQLLRSLGVLAARRGDPVLAEAYYKDGLALARRTDIGGNSESTLLRGLGVQAYMRGDYDEADAFYEEGRSLLLAGDELDKSGSMLWGMGALAEEQGDWRQAEQYYREGLARAERIGHRERVLTLQLNLARVLQAQELGEAAEHYLETALALARDLGHRWRTAVILGDQAELLLRRNEISGARRAWRELYEIARIIGSQRLVAQALYGLGRIAVHGGEREQAIEYGRESLSLYELFDNGKAADVRHWLAEIGIKGRRQAN